MTRPVQPSSLTSTTSVVKSENARRKRLGQYFTGGKLARLLVAITEAARCRLAVDPMCGSGDMLAAVRDVSPRATLAGVEIDGVAYEQCVARFKGSSNQISLVQGNAFSWRTISFLPITSYDLVITNPPYVRYQSFAGGKDTGSDGLPRAEEVRRGLLDIAQNLPDLEEEDREIFASIIKSYSGLSDLAVPSWVLCMMLTGIGGRLAMVVPDSWLNRDYAYPIHYLLLKLFRILWVVEDANRAWFDEAQVKTTLLVAERIPRADDLRAACTNRKYLHVALPASVMTEHSVVGGIFPRSANPEADFARALARMNDEIDNDLVSGFSVSRRDLSVKLDDLLSSSADAKWLGACEPALTKDETPRYRNESSGVKIPHALYDLLAPHGAPQFTTIEALGGHIGQGLRTGANEFFYCDLISETDSECLVTPGRALKADPILVPKAALRPVLRKQSEAPSGYLLDLANLRGRVLVLEDFIHPDDLAKADRGGEDRDSSWRLMTPSLASFVSYVEGLNVGTDETPKWIPQMSAVRTNVTKGKDGQGRARFWYMLPKLAKRHLPDLFIPRINYLHPKTFLNSAERTAIDANFSTIWLDEGANVDAFALLAYLNSAWAVAAMELSAAVMGGGALKLEATHLRRLPLPILSARQWDDLTIFGRRLAGGEAPEETLRAINRNLTQAIFGEDKAERALRDIETLRSDRLAARSNK